jgi:tripartite ATP-independent transporter DctP family solute receptor
MVERKWMAVFTALIVSVSFVTGMIGVNEVSAADKPIVFKINIAGPKYPPSKHPCSEPIVYFADRLKEKSKGRLIGKIYWAGSLYRDDPTQYAAIRDGALEMGESSGARLGSEIFAINLMELPFMFKNMEHVRRFFYGPKGFAPAGPAQKLFEPLYAKRGYKLVSFWQYGFQNFVSSKGFLTKPEDFKGVKFRVRQSQLAARIMEAFGGSAQAIPYMETYTALQLKTVDAAECPLAVIQGVKWHETGNYITISRHSLLYLAWLANPKWYNSLPPDLKKIFDETVEEANEREFNYQQDMELKMPWIMMSEVPSLKFKWLTEDERNGLKKAAEPLIDEYKKSIGKEFWNALDETRPK